VGRLLGRFSNRRDIVLIDQRGTGRSAPLLCDDDAPQRPLRESADPAAVQQALQRCRQALQQLPHGDLRQYTTAIAMQDTDAVRQALGLARINLVARRTARGRRWTTCGSTRSTVRRVVLDGVAPPDMALPRSVAVDGQAAFDALLAWCDADTGCSRQHPQLRQTWQRLLASLPREVTVHAPADRRDETLRLTPDMLAGLVRAPLYAPAWRRRCRLALQRSGRRPLVAMAGLAMALGGARAGPLAQGMHFSVVCAEDMPLLERPGAGRSDFGAAMTEPCTARPAPTGRAVPVPADFYRVPASPVPVLLLSGAIDPVTPPRHGQRVAQALGGNARHVVVPNAGHGVMGLGCLRDLVFRFVDAEADAVALALDTGCAKGVPRPPVFHLPLAETPK
jgi:pimeloyl-ACP methyl ester carboxylesterase